MQYRPTRRAVAREGRSPASGIRVEKTVHCASEYEVRDGSDDVAEPLVRISVECRALGLVEKLMASSRLIRGNGSMEHHLDGQIELEEPVDAARGSISPRYPPRALNAS